MRGLVPNTGCAIVLFLHCCPRSGLMHQTHNWPPRRLVVAAFFELYQYFRGQRSCSVFSLRKSITRRVKGEQDRWMAVHEFSRRTQHFELGERRLRGRTVLFQHPTKGLACGVQLRSRLPDD